MKKRAAYDKVLATKPYLTRKKAPLINYVGMEP
jgi:hypothetical protein